MFRTARITPGGMVFHVLNRGVGRMRLSNKDRDYEAFEEMIAKTLLSCPMRICSYLSTSQSRALRRAVNKRQPYGSESWVKKL